MSTAQCIVVVEDNDEDYEAVVEAARRSGIPHFLHRAPTGGECLNMLQTSLQNRSNLPVLLLLDLNTPGDDGRDALRVIKSCLQLCTIPTIVMSTSDNPRDVDFCYANHANAYHTKPVSYPAHLKTLQDIFSYWLDCALLPTAHRQENP